jgi:CO dehydrogenase nickel-insertion accessory protein CooC1
MNKEEILNKFTTLNDEEKLTVVKELLKEIEHNKTEKIDYKDPDSSPSLFNELEIEETITELEEKQEIVKTHTRRKPGSKNLVNDENNFEVVIVNHEQKDLKCPQVVMI